METLTAIEGVRVGHFTDTKHLTGCTVVRFPKDGAVAGVDVRGSAPGTRETDLLSPTNLVERIHALVFSGGSAYGLDAACGVVRCLEESRVGFDTGGGILVPIVPAAILYDLKLGDSSTRPNAQWGYEACKNATDQPVAQGNVGAGMGATVGKMLGMENAMKGGLGSCAEQISGGVIIAALILVNAVGDVVDPNTGKILAGTRGKRERNFLDSSKLLRERANATIFPGENTTIGVVATNATYNKTELTKIAQMAHDGLARAIRPSHTMYDGDTLFAVSVPSRKIHEKLSVTLAGSLAAEVVAQAILRAILKAKGIPGFPCSRDWARWIGD